MLAMGTIAVSSHSAWAGQRVQLSVFMVNVVESGQKKTGQMPVTVYLDLKGREEASYVCGIAPRIRSAILEHLTKETFYLDKKEKLDVSKIRLDIWPIAYKMITNVKLLNMLVVQDRGKVNSSEARIFARMGCRHVSN